MFHRFQGEHVFYTVDVCLILSDYLLGGFWHGTPNHPGHGWPFDVRIPRWSHLLKQMCPTAYGPPSHFCLECPWIVGRLTHGLRPMFRMTIPLLWLFECYIIIPLTMTHSTGPLDPSGPGFRAALDSRPDKAAEFWRCPVGETRKMRRCDHQKKWKMSYFMRDVSITLW
jgi:hypothetical protein